MRLGVLVGVAITTSSMGLASTPSPMLMGVQRVVIACSFSSTMMKMDYDGICEQLVRKASRLTSLPVAISSSTNLDPVGSAAIKNDLLLRVEASVRDISDGRKSLTLKVTPVRLARTQGEFGPITSSASLVRVQSTWIVQGQIDAFNKLLGSSPPRLRKPVRAER